ncbi:RHS repeat-associated core domain-containing protein [Entomospira entomophila]|uniref:RHS repeat-associated core domain-containing protein n=1 Tax=Entomospira entomophila TaxID=2719988 RepID=A0A968KWQ8_9SPIO|nr:RHS repeat-associated core domain-containing protein [Entomospira entomophilus]NIZ41055.1 RHS repeat-associated core domain-containing protein [Entomospira entomophilus]WDI35264.1 RHS repeat-associated core domain-containing protein [Entomospira entomophilus]
MMHQGQRTFKKSSQRENLYYDKMWQVDVTGRNNIEYKNIYLGRDRLLTKMGNEAYHNASDNSYQRINQYYNHANHIGSVNVISDYQGKEFKYVEYTPYGEEWFSETSNLNSGAVGPDGLEYGFTDHLHDEETGLIYANARYLDPKTSRWMSSDPAMADYMPLSKEHKNAEEYNQNLPGMGGIYNSRNLQTYHYAGNNPLKYTDPTGQWIWLVWAGVGVAVAWQSYREVRAKQALGESGWSVLTDWRALARIGIAGGLTYLGGVWAGSVGVGTMATAEVLTVGAFMGGELHLLQELLFMLTRNGEFDESDFTVGFAQAMFLGTIGSLIDNEVFGAMLGELPYIASLFKGKQGSDKTDWGRIEREFREKYTRIRDAVRAQGFDMPETYEEFEEEMRIAAEEAQEQIRVDEINRAKGIKSLSPAP